METSFAETRSTVLTIAVILTIMGVLVGYPTFALRELRKRRLYAAKDKLMRGAAAVLGRCAEPRDIVLQLGITYKNAIEAHPTLTGDYPSIGSVLEDFIVATDTLDSAFFAVRRIDPERLEEMRTRALAALLLSREREPFAAVSGKTANLLNMLATALQADNRELARTMLEQLADGISSLEAGLRREARRNQTSFIVSAVGVILSVVFGLLSLVPLVAALGPGSRPP